MAGNRTTLDFNFVALVLSVTGRVRPDDLQAVPSTERVSLLHAYADTYGASTPLHFEADTLVAGAGDPLPAPPTPVAPPTAPAFVPAQGATHPDPSAATAATAVSASPAVPDPFADSAYTSATAAHAADAGAFFPGSPMPLAAVPGGAPSAGAVALPVADGAFFGMPESAGLQPAAFADPAAAAIAGATAAPYAAEDVADTAQPKASFLFWLLPVLLTWVGGLVAYFVVRPTNEKQAKTMLITGIVLTVAYVLIGVAGFFGLGMLTASLVR